MPPALFQNNRPGGGARGQLNAIVTDPERE